MAAAPKIIVVGGGLAGLAAVIKIAEMGGNVDLFSIVPVKRSHSVCAQGGINAAKNLKGEGDSTWQHFDDTIYGGDFLANQPPVKAMCDAAPGIIDLLDRMGVPFNRTPEGLLDFRRFGGTLYNRTAFAGATTGQQLLYALDEQVRRYESEGKVTKYEHWEFLSAVLDGNRVCRGICAMDLRTMEIRTFPADAIIIATGGIGAIFGKSTNSVVCTGSAQSALYQQGCFLCQRRIHPGSPNVDSGRRQAAPDVGVGARRRRPRVGARRSRATTATPRAFPIASAGISLRSGTRSTEIWCRATSRPAPSSRWSTSTTSALTASRWSILDLTHIDRKILDKKLEGILEIYEKFVGDDPRDTPMKIFPGMHYTMGGLWVDFKQATNIAGIYSAGECEYQYHGANRLGANSLVSCIWGGFISGPNAVQYARGLQNSDGNGAFDAERKRQQEINDGLMKADGTENPFKLWQELGDEMTKNCTVIRYNKNLQQCDAKLVELLERFQKSISAIEASGRIQQLHLRVSFITCCNCLA